MNAAKGSDRGNSFGNEEGQKSRLEKRDVQVPREGGGAYAF